MKWQELLIYPVYELSNCLSKMPYTLISSIIGLYGLVELFIFDLLFIIYLKLFLKNPQSDYIVNHFFKSFYTMHMA